MGVDDCNDMNCTYKVSDNINRHLEKKKYKLIQLPRETLLNCSAATSFSRTVNMPEENQISNLSSSSSSSEDETTTVEEQKSNKRSRNLAKPRSSKKIHPIAPAKPLKASDLFGTDSEEEEDACSSIKKDGSHKKKHKHSSRRAEASTSASTSAKKRKHSPVASTSGCVAPPSAPASSPVPSTAEKRKSNTNAPVAFKKSTTREMFGIEVDSDDDIDESSRPGKRPAPLNSYINRKLMNGLVRQSYDNKPGSYFVELKVYNCADIERVQPMNRWRHAVVTIKNRTNDDTEAWRSLTSFIAATRHEFKDCPPTFIPNH